MTYTFVVTILQWAYIPLLVRALNCYQCETEDTFQSCLKNPANLKACDAGDVCYNMTGNWDGDSVVFRGCADEDITLGCKKEYKYCSMFWNDQYCEIPCIDWENCDESFYTKIWRKFTKTVWQRGVQNLTKVRMDVTDISMCHCETDGCNTDGPSNNDPITDGPITSGCNTKGRNTDDWNSSFKHDPHALYIIFTLASISSVLARII